VGCVLAREVWPVCLRWWGKLGWIPQANTRFVRWLQGKRGGPGKDRDLWTGITLVCWCLWRHRNDVVFEGASPSRETVLAWITDKAELWRATGLFKDALAVVDKCRCHEQSVACECFLDAAWGCTLWRMYLECLVRLTFWPASSILKPIHLSMMYPCSLLEYAIWTSWAALLMEPRVPIQCTDTSTLHVTPVANSVYTSVLLSVPFN
jgi:hypothetical protein